MDMLELFDRTYISQRLLAFIFEMENEKDSNKQKIEVYKNKIADLDRVIGDLSNEFHSLQKKLELQRANVDVLIIKNKESNQSLSVILIFFLICFSAWLIVH